MGRFFLQTILKASLDDFVIVCDDARSHSCQISIVPCQRRQLAQERRDERRWLSIPGDVPKSRPTSNNKGEEEKVGKDSSSCDTKESSSSNWSRPARFSLASSLVKPVRQVSIKQLQTEKLPSLPKSGQRRTLEKSGSNRRLRLSRQGSREFVCKQGDDKVSQSRKISLKVSCQDLNTILAGGAGSNGPLRIPVRQRSVKGIDCSNHGKERDVGTGNKEVQQLSKENNILKPDLLSVSDSTSAREHSTSPKFKRKSLNSTAYLLFESPSRKVSIVPKQ